ncbi:MAG: polyprenol monophosphomannose synthase [Patescibacteria group bacterium]
MKIWLIIPTYNEKSTIIQLLEALFGLPLELSILVVDDNSPDQTAQLVQSAQSQYKNLHLVKRPAKLGLGSAYRFGFDYALHRGAEAVGQMDADWSHQPVDVLKLLAAINNGGDAAIGSRRVTGGEISGWNWRRHFMSRGATWLARLVLRLKTQDITAGFRFYTKAALSRIPWSQVKSEGYAWQEETIFLCEQAGLKIIEVPVKFVDRQQGQSKLGLRDVVEFFKAVFRLKLVKILATKKHS